MSPRTRGNRQGSVRHMGGTRWQLRIRTRDGGRYERIIKAKTKTEALRILDAERKRIWSGDAPAVVRVRDLLPLIIQSYQQRGQKVAEVHQRWRHLEPAFASHYVEDVTTAQLSDYVAERRKSAKPATINRELSILRRMFNLGYRATPRLVASVPHFPLMREDNARTGFFEHDEYLALHRELPSYLRPLLTVAYRTGCRIGELTSLRWPQLDLQTGELRLHARGTKTKTGRVIFLGEDSLEEVRAWRTTTRALELQTGEVIAHVFHRGGKKIGSFRKAWASARKRAGLVGKIPHDLRRTATRNLVRSGVSEHVAMSITGHKTRSVFDRYDIVSEEDLRNAARQVEQNTPRIPHAPGDAAKSSNSRGRK